MRPVCAAFLAVSLDGCIARSDGRLDWLDAANAAAPPGEDFGYAAFYAGVDAVVMGRGTFETVAGFDVWPFDGKPTVVLTSRPAALGAARFADRIDALDATPAEAAARCAAAGARRLYIDGGETIRRFLAAGLLDELTLTVIPVALGEGRRLFGPLEKDLALDHVTTRTFDCGYVQLAYRVRHDQDRPAPPLS